MIVNTVSEAKAQLSALIERTLRGEEVIISRAGKPVAILMAYDACPTKRKPGVLSGKIRIAPDFDELQEEIGEAFGIVDR